MSLFPFCLCCGFSLKIRNAIEDFQGKFSTKMRTIVGTDKPLAYYFTRITVSPSRSGRMSCSTRGSAATWSLKRRMPAVCGSLS